MTLGSPDWSPHCPDALGPTLIGPSLVLMVTEVESSPNWRWQRAHASLLSSMESEPHNDNTTIYEQSSKHPAVSRNWQWDIDPCCLNFRKKENLSQENDLPEWKDFTIAMFCPFVFGWKFVLTQSDLIIVSICLPIAPCSLFVPVLSFLSAVWCYEGDKSVI